MGRRHRKKEARRADRHGFTIIETAIAGFLLIIIFFGLARVYARGRVHLDFEEDRRRATAVAQARLEGLRRDFRYDDLPGLAETDTTYLVDQRPFTVTHQVVPGAPEDQATTVTVTVQWIANVMGRDVDRTLTCTTIFGRGMAW